MNKRYPILGFPGYFISRNCAWSPRGKMTINKKRGTICIGGKNRSHASLFETASHGKTISATYKEVEIVKTLGQTPQKQQVRDSLLELVQQHLERPVCLTFPGTEAALEQDLAKIRGSEIVCIEMVERIAKIAQRNLPRKASLYVGQAKQFLNKPVKKFNFVWIDTMCDWTVQQQSLIDQLYMNGHLDPEGAIVALTVIDQYRHPVSVEANPENIYRIMAGTGKGFGYSVRPLRNIEYKTKGGYPAIVLALWIQKGEKEYKYEPTNQMVMQDF